jgi:type II secretory pathway component PulF
MSRTRPLPLSALVELSRALRHYLGAGLSLVDVFRQQAKRGPSALRPVAADIAKDLERGNDLEHALDLHADAFPPLFHALAGVGEESGALPEAFAELEKYFRLQQQLRRQFWSRITWPLFQFVLGVFVVAGMIFILGLFGSDFDPLGLGLTGTGGALKFLVIVWGTVGVLIGTFVLLRRSLRRRARIDAWLLRLPAVGPCLQALALNRFCLALRLTTETGMPIARAVRLSLRATGNEAFVARTDVVVRALKQGEELWAALDRSRLLPEDFRNILAGAEEAGRLADVLRHQADHYEEEAGRRLAVLTSVAGYGVWLVIGTLLVVTIFRLYFSYFSLLNTAG